MAYDMINNIGGHQAAFALNEVKSVPFPEDRGSFTGNLRGFVYEETLGIGGMTLPAVFVSLRQFYNLAEGQDSPR